MTKCITVYDNKETFNRGYVKPEDYAHFRVFLCDSAEEEEIISHIPPHLYYKIESLPHYDLSADRTLRERARNKTKI